MSGSSLKEQATATKLTYYERVIASAYAEGATAAAIDAHLTSQGVKDPDVWRARVEAKPRVRQLGAIELSKLGGRNEFRALFGLPPVTEHTVLPVATPMTRHMPPLFVRKDGGGEPIAKHQGNIRLALAAMKLTVSYDAFGAKTLVTHHGLTQPL